LVASSVEGCQWKTLSSLIIRALNQRTLKICSQYSFQTNHGLLFIYISPLIYYHQGSLILYSRSLICMTKMTHFAPCNKTITVEEKIRLFSNNSYQYHRLLDYIIVNWRLQFIFKFLRFLFEILKVKIELSFAFIFKITVKPSMSIKYWLEYYLCCNINYQKDDLTLYFSLTQFAYNNTIHASTQ